MINKIKLNKQKIRLKLYGLISSSQYTFDEIADFLELESPRVIYEWTKGTKLPNHENLYNLAKLLNVQCDDILAG